MNINQLLHFLVVVDECRSAAEVVKELEKLIRSYGFEYYGVVRQPKPDENPMELVLTGEWPEGWPQPHDARGDHGAGSGGRGRNACSVVPVSYHPL